MSTVVDIEKPEFENVVRQMVTKIIQELLSKESPESQIALMLHAHIRDFSKFRCEIQRELSDFRHEVQTKFERIDSELNKINGKFNQVDEQFKQVDERFDQVDKRLDCIENTMATKEDLKQFATKEDLKQFATKEDLKQFATKEDLNAQTLKIIDAVRRIWVTEGMQP
jgi:hypothetical protein